MKHQNVFLILANRIRFYFKIWMPFKQHATLYFQLKTFAHIPGHISFIESKIYSLKNVFGTVVYMCYLNIYVLFKVRKIYYVPL